MACAFSVAGFTVATAQETTTDTTSGHHRHHESVLTADEKAELKKDREQAFAADPALKSEGKALWEQRKSMKDASADDKKAFHEKLHAHFAKVEAAIEKIDSNAAPIIAKLKAAHHHHHPKGDADASSDSSNS